MKIKKPKTSSANPRLCPKIWTSRVIIQICLILMKVVLAADPISHMLSETEGTNDPMERPYIYILKYTHISEIGENNNINKYVLNYIGVAMQNAATGCGKHF